MTEIDRRDAIGMMGLGLAAAAIATPASAQTADIAPAFAGQHKPVPLGFDPAKLPGLSEKLIRSHYENNYIGSVRTLNMIEQRLSAAMADKDLPPVVYGGLKREELHRTGSVILHELYFSALGGDGAAAGYVQKAIASAFGSFAAWDAEFRRTALSLAGGSGWCVLAWNTHSASLHNYWAWDHMHQPVASIPLIALDMYEHAYHMDYGTAAAKYVDAFMANLDWQVIDRRYRRVAGTGCGCAL
jgi:Fe-Mn family superoxide dismutase